MSNNELNKIRQDIISLQIIIECLIAELAELKILDMHKFSDKISDKLDELNDILVKSKTNYDAMDDSLLKTKYASHIVGEA